MEWNYDDLMKWNDETDTDVPNVTNLDIRWNKLKTLPLKIFKLHKEQVETSLLDRGYSKDVVNEYLEYIE